MNKPLENASLANVGADSKAISAAIQTKLLDTLIEQKGSVIVGQLCCAALAFFCYCRSHQNWLLLWAFSLLVLLSARLWMTWLYQRHKDFRTKRIWAYRFITCALLTSVSFGLASANSVLYSDAFIQMLIISAQTAYVVASAVRNNGAPRAAALQGVIPLAFLDVGCIATGDSYYIAVAIFVALHSVTVIQIIRFLYRKTLSLLLAEERAAEAAEALTEANARLQSLAATDTLTGVMNRRGFEIALANECGRASRFNEEFSLLLLDIDHFKMLNDTHGHQYGDDCLRQVGACLQTLVRAQTDVAGRYGGEEFVIILPKTSYSEAALAAERFRAAIHELAFPHPSSGFGVVTVSVGYATFQRGVLEDSSAIVKAADEALYYVKRTCRNAAAGYRDLEKNISAQATIPVS